MLGDLCCPTAPLPCLKLVDVPAANPPFPCFRATQPPEGDNADGEVDEGHTSGRASPPGKARRTINFVTFAPASSPVVTVNIRNIRACKPRRSNCPTSKGHGKDTTLRDVSDFRANSSLGAIARDASCR